MEATTPIYRQPVIAVAALELPIHDHQPEASEARRDGEPQQFAPSVESTAHAPDSTALLPALWGSQDYFHFLGVLDGTKQFQQITASSVEDAISQAEQHSRDGLDVFFACAEYNSPDSRRADNVRHARAFWMDIDCGAEKAASNKGYTDSVEAQAKLLAFCNAARLPRPTHLVASGGGLHAYWCLGEPVERDVWRVQALRFKAIAAAHHLHADPSRTADIASQLRVPGTFNYKYNPPAPVQLLSAPGAQLKSSDMLSAIEVEHARIAFDAHAAAHSPPPDINRLTSALRALDPDCDEPTWKLRRLAPLASAAHDHPQLAVALEELARSWSSGALRGRPSSSWSMPGGNGRAGAEIFEETWSRLLGSHFAGERTTLATVFYDAKKAGWREDGGMQSGLCLETHNGYATDLVKRLTVGGHRPVGHSGRIFVVDPASSVWLPQSHDAIVRAVSETYDGRKGCTRRTDYLAIAAQAVSLVAAPEFFEQAPAGLACVKAFYRIDKGAIVAEPLTPEHRQRVLLPFDPAEQVTPRFDQFLHDTFESATPNEQEEQIRLVQEIAGATMLGLMARLQKAVVFYDPYGRAGKGTLESILRCLVPSQFVTAVSPFSWDQEYFLATLAGSRLNVVGELPSDRFLPGAAFKSVLGRDLQTGRNPAQMPFTFRNEAAHIFMSNHFIGTKDQSEAFFARWLLVEFPNSLLRSGKPLDPGLADSIIETELPGIAAWALEGGKRLLDAKKFSPSMAHERLMTRWRRSSNSLEEFIAECCELGPTAKARRSLLYQAYKSWCTDNVRKPFAKSTVKGLLEHNLGLGISLAALDGYEIFRGVRLKEDVEAEFTL